jgi:hypothetical protein
MTLILLGFQLWYMVIDLGWAASFDFFWGLESGFSSFERVWRAFSKALIPFSKALARLWQGFGKALIPP